MSERTPRQAATALPANPYLGVDRRAGLWAATIALLAYGLWRWAADSDAVWLLALSALAMASALGLAVFAAIQALHRWNWNRSVRIDTLAAHWEYTDDHWRNLAKVQASWIGRYQARSILGLSLLPVIAALDHLFHGTVSATDGWLALSVVGLVVLATLARRFADEYERVRYEEIPQGAWIGDGWLVFHDSRFCDRTNVSFREANVDAGRELLVVKAQGANTIYTVNIPVPPGRIDEAYDAAVRLMRGDPT